MTSFQERFKGKTSTISKEGVIPNLDKPPISNQYIQKDSNAMSNLNYNNNNNAQANPFKKQTQSYTSNSPAQSPLSNPYVVNQGANTTASSKNSSQKSYTNNGLQSDKNNNNKINNNNNVNKQQLSNSNFSTRSEQSNSSKISINKKIQQQNDPYNIANPFTLDMAALNQASQNGLSKQYSAKGGMSPTLSHQNYQYQQQQQQQQLNYNSNKNIGDKQQIKNSGSSYNFQNSQNMMDIGGTHDQLFSHVNSDNQLGIPLSQQQSSSSYKSYTDSNNNHNKINKNQVYTLENNTKSTNNNNNKTQPNSISNSNNNPYKNYNPYTLNSLEANHHNIGEREKSQSSGEMRTINNMNGKRIVDIQANKEEQEASNYLQSYIPSFAQNQPSLNTNNNSASNASKKNIIQSNGYAPIPQNSLGGLGANIGTQEWNQKKEKQDKIQEYSAQVKYFNQQQQQQQQSGGLLPPSNQRRPIQKEEEKEKSTRERALEFSKNIPKPKIRSDKITTEESGSTTSKQSERNNKYNYFDDTVQSKNNNNNDSLLKSNNSGKNNNSYKNQYESDIDILERQHLEYLNKIESLNINS